MSHLHIWAIISVSGHLIFHISPPASPFQLNVYIYIIAFLSLFGLRQQQDELDEIPAPVSTIHRTKGSLHADLTFFFFFVSKTDLHIPVTVKSPNRPWNDFDLTSICLALKGVRRPAPTAATSLFWR